MGKGDKKSKRGKMIIGSYGVSRPRIKRNSYVPPVAKPMIVEDPKQEIIEVPAEEQIKVPKKKVAAKKPSKKEVEIIQVAEPQPEQIKAKKAPSKKPVAAEKVKPVGTKGKAKE